MLNVFKYEKKEEKKSKHRFYEDDVNGSTRFFRVIIIPSDDRA